MKPIALILLAAGLRLSAQVPAPDPVTPPWVAPATAAWLASKTEAERDAIVAKYGPIGYDMINAISDDGELILKTGDFAAALDRYHFCDGLALRANDVYWLAVCRQLEAGAERLQGKYVQSEQHYREALVFAEKTGIPKRISFVISNLGALLATQSRFSEATVLLRRALQVAADGGMADDAPPLQNLAIIYSLQGDFAHGLEYFLKALAIYEKIGDLNKQALTHFNIGELQLMQSNYAAATPELELAVALGEKSGNRSSTAQALGDLGRVRDKEGHTQEAIDLLLRSQAFCLKSGYRSGIGDSYVNLGNLYLGHDELKLAAENFEEGLKVFEELHSKTDLGIALRGLGYVAFRQSNYAAARDYAAKALDAARDGEDKSGAWQAETLFGMALRGLGNTEQALAAFHRATAIVEEQRDKVGGGETEKQRFFERAVFPYQQIVAIEAERGNGLAALQSAERARARVLLDMLGAGPERIDRFMTQAERDRERELRSQIAGTNAWVARAKPVDKPAAEKERDNVWQAREAFLAALYVQKPELRAWRGESPVIEASELARLTPDTRTALVEFVAGEEETFLFVVTRAGAAAAPAVAIFRLPVGGRKLAARLQNFRSLLEGRDPGFRGSAQSLYSELLLPAAGLLKDRTRVYLVADGPLAEFPFQALIAPSGHYWVEDAAISWAPSLTFLRDQMAARVKQTSEEKRTYDLVAFADPTIQGSAAIPVLREQVRRVAALYNPARVKTLAGKDATEAAFRDEAPSGRIVHLATHGTYDENNAMRSRVFLSKSGEDDGWVEAWELTQMNLKADLAILSACESARGESAAGEGLMGLTWALFASGVHNAVVSQWRVESNSTSDLMVGLHQNLRKGLTPAESLRNATLALMKDPRYRHPMYWAAFISAGL